MQEGIRGERDRGREREKTKKKTIKRTKARMYSSVATLSIETEAHMQERIYFRLLLAYTSACIAYVSVHMYVC